MTLTPQWLDELRSQGSTLVRADRAYRQDCHQGGARVKACCPFHNEKTPSFTINDEKGFYHCFGCSAHGDAIRWMTDQRGLSFMDAIKELAAEAGMEVPAPDPKAAQRAEKANNLYDVMAAAQDWFVAQLNKIWMARTRGNICRKARALSAETIKAFGFGFAPDSRTAI